MRKKIDISWYQNEDVIYVARKLLGKVLCTTIDKKTVKGIIVETEAYSGDNDKACHANNQKLTKRNRLMFEPGGVVYVYLCYGIHTLLNIVTNRRGKADAVLIRAIEPIQGFDVMMDRRNMVKIEKRLTSGPGVLSQAFGITTTAYGTSLDSNIIWIEESEPVPDAAIVCCTRIGVEYAKEDALKPWRFYIKENNWVSRI